MTIPDNNVVVLKVSEFHIQHLPLTCGYIESMHRLWLKRIREAILAYGCMDVICHLASREVSLIPPPSSGDEVGTVSFRPGGDLYLITRASG